LYCSICQLAPTTVGILCADCRSDLKPPVMAPEQVSARIANPTRAALVDYWGRVHLLDPVSIVGRDLEDESGIAIHQGSVSRHHAKLAVDEVPSGQAWTVCDLGSSNGTFLEDTRVEAAAAIHARDKLKFGDISFYFLEHVYDIPHAIVDIETVRPGPAIVMPEPTPSMTPRVCDVQLHEPTGGGGGIIQIDGKQVQLTLAQLELVTFLLSRVDAEADRDPKIRGFVPVAELLGKLSLEASLPRDAHVRQLIRRVRRVFIKAELGDLIESRYGLGYRILLVPRR